MVHERIAIDPKVMSGKPVIRGTRIPVELIVRMVGQGIDDEEILREYPRLAKEDIRAAVSYAADVVAGEDVFNIPAA
jgi:uncharacterized protein (DUF433 family)/predicted nuclease of predicted toxin-antitoxin system